ncbi:SIN1-domain-containing protein [Neoconidiobolus thromboides FSU 785]|nr:SIN1-domain-containing protein [Neoconidiobolus thromboides FSU 785]
MSLITDSDYLIYKLKLTQLTNNQNNLSKLIKIDNNKIKENDYLLLDTSTHNITYSTSPDIIPSLPFSPKPLINKRFIRKEEFNLKEGDKLINNKNSDSTNNNNNNNNNNNDLLSEEDDDDDDIDLDYDEVNQDIKPKHIFKEAPQNSLKPKNLNRKFSGANLAASNALLPPAIPRPKSRMRSLSSSSLANGETKEITNTSTSPLKFNTTLKLQQRKTNVPISLLSKMLKVNSNSLQNPFLNDYGGFTGKGEQNPINLNIYLPNSNEPLTPLKVCVKRNATVEQVIGYSLYLYFDLKMEPELEEHLYLICNWTMLIAEDDGTIDEDFPALERTRQIEKFAFDCFALCQVPSNQLKYPEVKLSQEVQKNKASPNMEVKSLSNELNSNNNNNSQENHQLIKIQLFNQKGALHTTTLNIGSNTTLYSVQQIVCKKWNLELMDYELTSTQAKHPLEQQATLESLLGITELSLIRKNVISKDSNSILPFTPQSAAANIYKKYIVLRRMPMFVNKQERVLIIDGYYIYLLISEGNVGKFGMDVLAKNSSYHVSSLMSCRQSNKVRRRVKITFNRSHDHKIYDLETESPEVAEEIVTNLLFLKDCLKNDRN